MRCKNCNASSIEKEAGDLVCSECGLINEKDALHNDPVSEGTFFVKRNLVFQGEYSTLPFSFRRSLPSSKLCRSTKLVHQQTKIIGQYLKMDATDLKKLEYLLHELLRNELFFRKSIACKRILGAVIAYTLVQNSGHVVPMECLCEQLGCTLSDFKKVLNRFLLCKPEYRIAFKGITDWLPFYLNQAGMDDDEKRKIERLGRKALDLLTSTDTLQVNKQKNFIVAVIYTIWQVLDLSSRSKIKSNEFSAKFGLPFNTTTKKVYKELLGVISKLSAYLPWVSKDDQFLKSNPLFYFQDVLDNAAIIKQRYSSDEVNQQKELQVQESSNLVHSLCKKTDESEICNDVEISDSEIDSYIRSEEEVKFLQNLLKS